MQQPEGSNDVFSSFPRAELPAQETRQRQTMPPQYFEVSDWGGGGRSGLCRIKVIHWNPGVTPFESNLVIGCFFKINRYYEICELSKLCT